LTREDMLQDLAYARTLAEEGRQAPLIGGSYLVLFGVLLATAWTGQYFVMTSPELHNAWSGAIWMGFGLVAFLGMFALKARTRSLPGGASVGNRVDRAVWQGVAIGILAVVTGVILRSILTNDYAATDAIMAAGFCLYGVALYATASVSDQKWLRAFAWLAWGVSGTLWFFMGAAWAYLYAAVGAVLVLLIPGVVLMMREPSKIV
jgi:hypothetical protein